MINIFEKLIQSKDFSLLSCLLFTSQFTIFNSYVFAESTSVNLNKAYSGNNIQHVKYVQPRYTESRRKYVKALLESVLKITEPEFGPFVINTIYSDLVPSRKRIELIKGKTINLAWTTDDKTYQEQLIRIPFHTMKGVLGYRAMLIRKDRQSEFNDIDSPEKLQTMRPGQVHFWIDTEIYKKNNFEVMTAPDMNSLLLMLDKNRYDFFPLGVSEIRLEFERIKKNYPSLVIEDKLLVRYDLPVYFMVSPKELLLAERLTVGLKIIEENGEFDKLFNLYIQPELDALNFKNRTVIDLPN